MTLINAKVTSLEAALAIVKKMEWVVSAMIWTPDIEEIAEYKVNGIEACPQLEVTVYRSHRNATDIKIDIENLGMQCVGSGSACEGPCYSFILHA